MNVDAILRQIGEFGVYQKTIYLALNLFGITHGLRMMMAVYLLYTPLHRCAIPSYPNDTYEVQSSQHARLIRQFIPNNTKDDEDAPYDQCHLYTPSARAAPLGNVTSGDVACRSTMACPSGWVYDRSVFEKTAVVEFDMVCDDSLLGSHSQTAQMAGYFFGVLVIGAIGDKWGRKVAIYLSVLIYAAAGVGLSWTPRAGYAVFLLIRFINGATVSGAFTAACVLSVELVGPSKRIWVGVLIHLAFAVGGLLLGLIGYLIRDWAIINIVSTAPMFLGFVFWWLIPESPRWLAKKGRVKEAVKILRKVAKYNGKPFPETFFSGAAQERGGTGSVDQSQTTQEKGGAKDVNHGNEAAGSLRMPHEEGGGPLRNFLRMFTYRVLIIRNVVLFLNWFAVSMAYYGLSFTASQLATGDLFTNFLLSMAMDFPANMLVLFLLDRLGRRVLHTVFMVIGGGACLVGVFTTLVLSEAYQWATMVVAMLGKLASSASFILVYIYSSELLPTTVRSAGMGTSSAFARLGSILASYVQQWSLDMGGDLGQSLPLLVFGAISLVTGLMTLMLPETLHKDLPDTIEDALVFGRDPAKDETQDPTKTVEMYDLPGDVKVEMEAYKTTSSPSSPLPPPDHPGASGATATDTASAARADGKGETPDADLNKTDKVRQEIGRLTHGPSDKDASEASDSTGIPEPDDKRVSEDDDRTSGGDKRDSKDDNRILEPDDKQDLGGDSRISENDKQIPEDDNRTLERDAKRVLEGDERVPDNDKRVQDDGMRVTENDERVPGHGKRATEDEKQAEADEGEQREAGHSVNEETKSHAAVSPTESSKRVHFADASPAQDHSTEESADVAKNTQTSGDKDENLICHRF